MVGGGAIEVSLFRYVDNRVVLVNKELVDHAAFTTFLSDEFYVPPVLLEAVDTRGVQCVFL